ncbi:uncharacterized protein shn [Euwallacea fornicatus]|uniref:uncharacterized protein shn n=1 Tax=Euwallacea fornicatus TaxID=995702 RepID=UPI00338EFDFB
MDRSVDNYLHKKFKKQLSIVERKPQPLHQHNGKDNNATAVPNQSTNNEGLQTTSNSSKSSISVSESSGNSKSCISSSLVPLRPDRDSFDTSFSSRPIGSDVYCGDEHQQQQQNEEALPTPERNPVSGKYVCNYCNLVCSKPSVLQKHIRAHTNERPFPCTSCGFSFKTRSNLYKHCRSRTHANRVLGVKAQESSTGETDSKSQNYIDNATQTQQVYPGEDNNCEGARNKPYKPRFHTVPHPQQQLDDNRAISGNDLSHHINEIISKNNSIVNSESAGLLKRRGFSEADSVNNNEYNDEPLNLTNKNRKRCMSEATEPVMQKSLIKELLLKNLYSDMQCIYCKMIFQTVTELELHKLRSCKGKPSEAKYTRSSSVNVASILTKNKNAFDSMPQFQSAVFPLNSPGPFLGKTRLVEGDKNKSFSFDAVNLPSPTNETSPNYALPSPAPFHEEKKHHKLFGGEVKIHNSSGESKTYIIDSKDTAKQVENFDFPKGTMNENRVLKSSLHSGGTVLTNKTSKEEPRVYRDIIRVYENTSVSPNIDVVSLGKNHFTFNEENRESKPTESPKKEMSVLKYPNITDFSQNAVKLLAPNLKHPNIKLSGMFSQESKHISKIQKQTDQTNNLYNPMNLLVNGRVIRYVPGMPGPAEGPIDMGYPSRAQPSTTTVTTTVTSSPKPAEQPLKIKPPIETSSSEPKKFVRPNTLALKPSTASLKQHHGLTPTIFNQILISPDTPRVAKKYAQHLFNGNYFSYLGLKSSTKPVYCTLNKTQPFYVPHFKKLSMYSEWRQQDTKVDKMYVSAYDSRQRNQKFVTAGKTDANLIMHSSYKFLVTELPSRTEKDDEAHKAGLVGGYECNEESPYIRGRGRGRYVCEQCGIRCKKPSMLKKHIRTHSNDRPYTCNHCNFSFKTKGNLTKHMKSKSHTKNYTATSSGSSTGLSVSQSSDSDTDDSGMDSSDESMTRQQEHEAAYGLLSLSQKTSTSPTEMLSPASIMRTASPTPEFMTTEEVAYVSKTNYAKNKILDDLQFKPITSDANISGNSEKDKEEESLVAYLGKTQSSSRPLTYPYTSPLVENHRKEAPSEPKNIRQFHVIQKYVKEAPPNEKTPFLPSPVPTLKVNDVIVQEPPPAERKRKILEEESFKSKLHRNDEVMDLSVTSTDKRLYCTADPVDDMNFRNLDRNRKLSETNYHDVDMLSNSSGEFTRAAEYDNSAMETLADVATKQVKLDKNTSAKNVASEYLKLATQFDGVEGGNFVLNKEAVNELIVKSEGNKSCTICSKSFNKPFQLRLHMNIHYLERPFRCDSCSVSFRTKGHLQKHERSAGHYSKLSSSPAQSSSEPRPFKCSDCNVAFRIHGHLAKHLRSKLHIMKLECLAKIPFGLYAELERSNSLLTEINTSDGDQCLESLKTLAKKVFINDPGKLHSLISEGEPGLALIDPDS